MTVFMTENPELTGNFAPVTEEHRDAAVRVLEGAIPRELDGHFLRIGPNPLYVADPDKYSLFDGDGMVHRVRLKNGSAHYSNRFVETKGLKLEREHGKWLWKGMGDLDFSNPHGPIKNTANTALLWDGARLLATWEQGEPYELALEDLSTRGPVDFDGTLASAFTAHPKLDPVTGELMWFSYSPAFPPYLTYGIVRGGRIVHCEPIDLDSPSLMHDWVITEKYSLFFRFGVGFDLNGVLAGGPPFVWEPEAGAAIGVLPREGNSRQIRWFPIDPCYVLHAANAYEDGVELVVEACRSKIGNFPTRDGVRLGTEQERIERLHSWRLNLETGVVSESGVGEHGIDFTRIDDRKLGRRHRFVYATRSTPPDGAVHPNLRAFAQKLGTSLLFDGINQYDRRQGSCVTHALGPGRYCSGEAVFAPRPGGTEDNDGWVIAFVHDENEARSECVILDAQNLAGPAVARLLMPARVPYGFHAAWVPVGQG